jgi:hypothetical protein
MAEWFFRKKSKGEVERDPGWDEYCFHEHRLILQLRRSCAVKG